MNKFLGIVLSVLVLFSSVVSVSAAEYEPEIYITESYAIAEPEKAQNMFYDSAKYFVFQQAYNEIISQGDVHFGAALQVIHNPPQSNISRVIVDVQNVTDTLFTISGIFRLRMLSVCNELTVRVHRRGSSVESYTINPADYPEYIVDFRLPNYDSDIYRFELYFDGPVSYLGTDMIACTIHYGYESKEPTVQDAVKDAADRVVNAFSNALKNFFGDVNSSSSNSFDSSLNDLDNLHGDLMGAVGSPGDIVFYDEVFNIAEMKVCFQFISMYLMSLFVHIPFSVVFYFTCTLLLICILLGFARHWKGGK